MERAEPVHGLGRRRADPAGGAGGLGRREADRRATARGRRGLHVGAVARAEDDGAVAAVAAAVAAGRDELALERATLRRSHLAPQDGNHGTLGRGARHGHAPRRRQTAAHGPLASDVRAHRRGPRGARPERRAPARRVPAPDARACLGVLARPHLAETPRRALGGAEARRARGESSAHDSLAHSRARRPQPRRAPRPRRADRRAALVRDERRPTRGPGPVRGGARGQGEVARRDGSRVHARLSHSLFIVATPRPPLRAPALSPRGHPAYLHRRREVPRTGEPGRGDHRRLRAAQTERPSRRAASALPNQTVDRRRRRQIRRRLRSRLARRHRRRRRAAALQVRRPAHGLLAAATRSLRRVQTQQSALRRHRRLLLPPRDQARRFPGARAPRRRRRLPRLDPEKRRRVSARERVPLRLGRRQDRLALSGRDRRRPRRTRRSTLLAPGASPQQQVYPRRPLRALHQQTQPLTWSFTESLFFRVSRTGPDVVGALDFASTSSVSVEPPSRHALQTRPLSLGSGRQVVVEAACDHLRMT
mmetsp:Transcript_3953/g.12149  ORF Transcript_3953/g.12149 Transcript_3953/m.12149 type:complete len:535 (-) Transcript_3953:111-1715(-)